ncbi:MAG: SDR family oxidoreductase [Deltaproteobacteria bacterium]|nr:SDR family oxidoreductase [Deltaproteobacteria bacterium]
MSNAIIDPSQRAVAVVGLGAILPDASDVATFWQNVLAGRSSITEVPASRWSAADYYDPDPAVPDKTYSKIGGWVADQPFDSRKYRIPPKVADQMDEGQRWGVLAAGEALEDLKAPLDLENTGVIVGNAMGGEKHYRSSLRLAEPEILGALEATPGWAGLDAAARQALARGLHDQLAARYPETTEDTMPGELTNIMSGRIAAVFNLRGPNYTTDAACASSLAALDAAIQGLVDRHFDAVVTGGMDRNMGASTFIKFAKIGALSPDGSRPYAAGSNGFVMGEGGALFVLKRLADAERDGDRIYAVIRSVGASSDGKGKGITAPNPIGQILAVQRAWQRAGLEPNTATLIEGHGTSTPVGDVVEVESLAKVIGPGARPGSIALGSIKSQIGHLKSGAGAAGLLKAVLAVHHKVLPPSINFGSPNPNVDYAATPFFVNTEARTWEQPAGVPRRAGVSAFGFGGTNFHVVVEEHQPGVLTARQPMVSVPAAIGAAAQGGVQALPAPLGDLLTLGASSADALASKLGEALETAKRGPLPERVAPSGETLDAPHRLALAFEDREDLLDKGERALQAFAKGKPAAWRRLRSKGGHYGTGDAGKLAFLYPGQGSQYVNMLRSLQDEEVVRRTFAEADEVMTPILGKPLTEYVFFDGDDDAAKAAAEEALKDTTVCQPAVLATSVALTRLLAEHGIVPDMVMGHSLGEWGAVVAAGMLPFDKALVAVSARAQGMAEVSLDDPGKMASVLGARAEVEAKLAELDGYVVAANINSTRQTVIAGTSKDVEAAVEAFNAMGMTAQLIPVSHAFHSKIVAPATKVLRETIESMPVTPPKIPIISDVDGQFYPDTEAGLPEVRDRLARQMASPVQFVDGIETLHAAGARVFLEVGPKRVLTGFAEDIVGSREGVLTLSTNHPKRGDVGSFHDAMCGLHAAGFPRAAQRPRPVALPPPQPVAAPPAPVSAPAPVAAAPAAPSAAGPDYQALGHLFASFLEQGMALYQGIGERPQTPTLRPTPTAGPVATAAPVQRGSVVVSGAGLGLPGTSGRVFDDANIDRILAGESFIEAIPEAKREEMLERNVVRLVKRDVGEPSMDPVTDTSEVIRLAARRGAFDLAAEFGIDAPRVEAFDITTRLAIGAALEALKDAGIPLVRRYRKATTGKMLPGAWQLPESFADETGIVFASAFPGVDNLVDHLDRFHRGRLQEKVLAELKELREGTTDAETKSRLDARIAELEQAAAESRYVFDRRFLFQILSMGHSQLAELLGARGPNTQVNAACASTTQAVAIAEDWIRSGRCRRVIVVAADDVTSDNLLPWIGTGFLATGAASTEEDVKRAALPFDRRRNGMLIGMGACGLVLEAEDALRERGMRGISELLSSEVANSGFHGTRLDVAHIGGIMERLVATAERRHGLARRELAKELVFISHETYTPARGGSASAEVHALRQTFGDGADDIVIANTKGFTGHPQGAGIEDAVTAKILQKGIVPPVPNFQEPDPELGALNLSRGGAYPVRFALRLAAGFGSQVAMSLYRRIPGCEQRVADQAAYDRWIAGLVGRDQANLEIVDRTLRVKDAGAPGAAVAASRWTFGDTPAALAEGAGQPVARAQQAIAPALAPTPVTPASPPPTQKQTQTAAVPAPAPAAAAVDPVEQAVLAVVSAKTGYDTDMLELDLDLEADLGIDTVKQAEVFGEVREAFDIPPQDDLKLSDYPTLASVIGFVRKHRPDLAATVPAPAPAAQAAPAPAPQAAPVAAVDVVARAVMAVVSAKTGYDEDMLELDLDLEADLGIDTVKQAEVFGEVREQFGIPPQDDLKLSDYPSLQHVIDFVRKHRPDLAAAAPVPVTVMGTVTGTAPVAPAADGVDPVVAAVLSVVSAKTGYDQDMLELDLDLEADLGIDTVKQAEVFGQVREQFDIPPQDDLKLSEYPTLQHVIDFVRLHRSDLASPESWGAPAAPVEPTGQPAWAVVTGANPVTGPGTGTASAGQSTAGMDPIAQAVMAVVSEKTGYDEDMLELDLDLEADLGIDTVKQAEVFGQVREQFGIPPQDDLKLSEYPTLQHVIDFVRKHRPDAGAATAGASEPAAGPAAEAGGSEAALADRGRELARVPVPMVRAPLALCGPTGVSAEGRILVVCDGGGAGAQLAKALTERGASVAKVEVRKDPAAFEEEVREWASEGPVKGAFVLTGLDPMPAFADLDLAAWRKLNDDRVKLLRSTARALYEALGEAGTFLFTATRLGGLHGYGEEGALNPVSGAVTGFTKALARERPEALVKVVDFAEGATALDVAATLLAELERDRGVTEVGHLGDLRYTLGLQAHAEMPLGERRPLVLGRETVFLVTGGAGAVTTAIVNDLARASKGTFHLLDARPMPDEAMKADVAKLGADREGLKREVFERIKAAGGRATPVEVEKTLFDLERAGAILQVLADVEAAGGKAHYHSVDVTSDEAMGAVFRAIRAESKKVNVILHAAGLERSRALDAKEIAEWDLVFGVKSDGLFNLLKNTEADPPEAVVFFSSVAGRFGNAGQTDYSSGNDLMCKVASYWAARHPFHLAVSLDWTAWGGLGMATRGNIPEAMARAGIEMLEPSDGVPVIRQALESGFSGEAVIGRRLGILLEPPAGGELAMSALQRQDAERTLEVVSVEQNPHLGIAVTLRADPTAEPFLHDHQIEGTPVLPGVMGLEAFAETARLLLPRHTIKAMEEVSFEAPLKYFRGEARTMLVQARPFRVRDEIHLQVALSSSQALVGGRTQEKVHFSARVVLVSDREHLPEPEALPRPKDADAALDREAIYRVFFHGPAYQVLSKIERSNGGLRGVFQDELPAGTSRGGEGLFLPRLVEFGFQSAGVWEIGATGQLGLPSKLERVTVWPQAARGALLAEVASAGSAEAPAFDIVVRDTEGRVHAKLEGYRTSQLPGALAEEELAPFREVVPAT